MEIIVQEDQAMRVGNNRYFRVLSMVTLVATLSLPAMAKPKTFQNSDDSKEEGAPQKFLPDYDKLLKGKDAEWIYFPAGDLKSFKSVTIKDFVSNGDVGHKTQSENAAKYGKEFLQLWIEKQGFNVVQAGGELTLEGNVFDAWEPGGAQRYFMGWQAQAGCGLEILGKDTGGKIVAEIRHKSKGSTVHDAVENGLEDVAKSMAAGK